MSTDIPPPIRFPIWRLVTASLTSVFRYPSNFLSRAWPWIAIGTAIGVGAALTVSPESVSAAAGVLFFVLAALALVAAPLMFVVSWHRGLLLGEPGGGASAFRIDRPLWRYLGSLILVALLIMLFALPASIAMGVFMGVSGATPGSSGFDPAVFAFTALVALATIPITARTMLAFPMAAIDAAPPLIRGSWRLTAGNTCRLSAALLVAHIIGQAAILVIHVAVRLAASMLGETAAAMIEAPVQVTLLLLGAALFASLASYAYAVLTNHPLGRDVTGL